MEQNLIDVLIVGPGGIKGYQELGALYYIESFQMLNHTNCYIGVSVGAIICLLINLGLSVKEIIHLAVKNEDCFDINDLNWLHLLTNFKQNMGLLSTQKIRSVLEEIIITKLGFIPTFQQLYQITSKELVIVTYNLTKRCPQYNSYQNSPELSCLESILDSINIPLIFHIRYRDSCIYLDGAFGDPYPVLFKDDGKLNILGIYIDTELSDGSNYQNILIYLHDILQCLFHNITKRNIYEASAKCRHLKLKCNFLDTIGATITIADKAKMIIYGIKTAEKFFKSVTKCYI